MLYVRLPNRLQAMRLDQFYDALEPRSNIQRETIERLLDVLIQELNDSRHYPNYTFFAIFAGIVFACPGQRPFPDASLWADRATGHISEVPIKIGGENDPVPRHKLSGWTNVGWRNDTD
jgi:hypothetical protein